MASDLLRLMAVLGEHPALAFFLELALKSTLIAVLVLLPAFLLRNTAAAGQHLLWCLAILTLAFLPVFIGIVPKVEVALPATPTVTTGQLVPTAGTGAITTLHERIDAWWQPLLQVYLGGLLVLVLYTVFGLLRMQILSARATPGGNAPASRLLQEVLAEELLEIPVSLREHPTLGSPLSWGLLRPVIILPVASRAWPESKLRHVLLHELGHIQRMDWVTQLVGRFACAVYWYNPLVWYAARKMYELAEQACDDAVLLHDTSHTAYAGDLVAVAKAAAAPGRLQYLAQALATSFLGTRVIAILDTARSRKPGDSEWVIRGLLASFVLLAALASLKVGPATTLANFGGTLSRYISVRLLSAAAATVAPEQMVVHQRPELLLSHNLPELETIYIQSTPAPAGDFSAVLKAPVPVIALEELPGATVSKALRLLQKSFPAYPPEAEQRGIEGYTTVEYDITADGRVVNPAIIDSRPGSLFDKSALEAISAYRYEPPRINGTPVGIQGLRTRFIFQIDPDPG